MITLNEETVEVLRTMDYSATKNIANEICDLLRGKGFSPVQAELSGIGDLRRTVRRVELPENTVLPCQRHAGLRQLRQQTLGLR